MTAESPASPRWLWRAVAALVAVLFVVHVATRDDGRQWNGDAEQYTMHAENLAAGRPYAETGWVRNTERSLTPLAYPPGYPLLLAPVVAQTGRSRAPIAFLQALCLAAMTWLFAALFWRRLSPVSVLALVLLIGLSPFFWSFVSRGLSDVLFAAAVAAALVTIGRSERSAPRRAAYGWAVVAGLAAGAAILTRTLGVVVVPALVVPTLWPGRRAALRPALVAAAVAVLSSAMVLGAVDWEAGGRSSGAASGAGYGEIVRSGLLDKVERIPGFAVDRAVQYTLSDASVLWSPFVIPGPGHLPIRTAGLALMLLGVGVAVRRKLLAVDVFVVLYVAALLPWAFGWARYLLPVIPAAYGYLLLGGETAWQWARGRSLAYRFGVAVAVGLCAMAVGAFAVNGARAMAERAASGPSPPQSNGTDLVVRHIPDGGILLVADDARKVTYATGRSVSEVPRDTAAWGAYADRLGATHALFREDRAAVAAWAPRLGWRLVASDEAADLYVTADGAGEAPGPSPNR